MPAACGDSYFPTIAVGRRFFRIGPRRANAKGFEMTLQELQAKRNELAAKIQAMGDEFKANDKKWKDGEQAANWEKLNADYDAVVKQMSDLQAADTVAARMQAVADAQNALAPNPYNLGSQAGVPLGGDGDDLLRGMPIDQVRSLAISGWMRNQLTGDYSDRQRAAARACGLNLNARELSLQLLPTADLQALQRQFVASHPNRRSELFNAPLTTGTPATGGNIIPPETLLRSLELNMLTFGGIRQVAEIISTSTGEPLSWPTANDTGNEGRRIAESTVADDNAGGGSTGDGGPNPAFGKVTWNAYKYTSDTILVPHELLEDAVVDLASMLGMMLGERLGRVTSKEYTRTGTGSSQPTALITAAAVGVTAAGTAAITADEVVKLQHSVDPAYRIGAQFMLHDATVLLLRLLKDNEGRPLWQSGLSAGVPDTLAGSPIVVSNDMPTAAAGAKTMAYGQLSRYKIRRVNSVRLYRLTERYRERDQDGFVAFVREDGGLLNAGTPPVKTLQQAAS